MLKSPLLTIALLDSRSLSRRTLKNHLDVSGKYRVILEADTNEELIDLLKKSSAPPDILIMELELSPMSGYNLAEALKSDWPSIRIIVLSSIYTEYSVSTMLRNGVVGYLPKTTSIAEFHTCLQQVEEGKSYFQEITALYVSNLLHLGKNSESAKISPRELEFLSHCLTDSVYKQIAIEMKISPRTVEMYRDNLFKKLNVNTRMGLVRYGLLNGLISPK